MQQSNQETYSYQTNEIDLRKLAKLLKKRRWFIFCFTGIATLLGIVYALSLPPSPYIATASFEQPSESSAQSLNRFQLTTETIFASFLKKLSAKELQEKVFYGNDYLAALNPENEPIDDVEDYVIRFLGSISLIQSRDMREFRNDKLLDKPYSISMQGSNVEIMSKFLNELVVSANRETVNQIVLLKEQEISNRLDEIASEKGSLLEKAKQDRLSQIERIKEKDAQTIRELTDSIDRARYKAKQKRLNQIQILTANAQLAGSLGIIENNLRQNEIILESNNEFILESNNEINLNIRLDEDEYLPVWYLFGEKALLKRVEILKNRTSDDPFIPELVSLNNQINKIQNNNLLQTLEERQDDSLFIARINELDIEKIKLESSVVESSGINAMQLIHSSSEQSISGTKQIVQIALIGGFMLSIVLALMMNLFKEDETEPTTKTSR